MTLVAGRPADPRRAALAGVALMIMAALGFSIMNGLIRLLGDSLHPFQIAFLRFLIAGCFALPWVLHQGASFRTRRFGLHLVRSVATIISALLWFTSLTLLPLAQAVALNFTAPLFTTIGAALFLGEIVRIRRWLATMAGFAGVLMIARPGWGDTTPAMLLPLLAAATMTVAALLVKQLTRTDDTATILFYMNILPLPLLLVFAVPVWQWPTDREWMLLTAMGLAGFMSHMCFTRSFALADASFVIPFDYLRLPFIGVIAFWLFGEIPDAATLAGAGVIIGSAIYISRREAALTRSQRPVTGTPPVGRQNH